MGQIQPAVWSIHFYRKTTPIRLGALGVAYGGFCAPWFCAERWRQSLYVAHTAPDSPDVDLDRERLPTPALHHNVTLSQQQLT